MAQVETPDLITRLRGHLDTAGRRLADLESRVMRDLMAAGRSDHGVLDCLHEAGPLSVSEVGRKLHLTSGAATSAIDRVERRKWVFRSPKPGDRRMVTVELTATGREVFERTEPLIRERVGTLFSGLNEVERTQLVSLLRKITVKGENEPSGDPLPAKQAEPGLTGQGFQGSKLMGMD